MGHALEMSFDAEAEERIEGLWMTLVCEGISPILLDFGERPHIGLAVLEDADPDDDRGLFRLNLDGSGIQ